MSTRRVVPVLFVLAAVVGLLVVSPAYAQATRTWVSGVGDDVNPCSRTAPCKTFAGAISKTAANGEISVLDPGGFGAVTITKAITINGDGTLAGILASLTNGVVINAAGNTAQVILRNLSINGAGNGLDGIRFLQGRHLIVENCVVFGFTGDALDIAPSAGAVFNITVRNTSFIRNGNGIRNSPAIGTTNSSYDRLLISNNTGDGIIASGGTVNVSNSVIDSNSNGISVSSSSVVNANDNVITSNTGNGINNSGSTVRYNNNNIHRNGTGIAGVGTHQTFANNTVIGNTTDVGAGVVFTNVTATNLR